MHVCMVPCRSDVAGGLPCVRPQPRPSAHFYSASSRMRLERAPRVAWQKEVPRTSTFPALLGLVVLIALAPPPSLASAAPVVTLKARYVPIPGFPHTGNIPGAGAAIEVHYTIAGDEVTGGVPSQLRRVTYFLPKGTVFHPAAFKTCA